MQFKKIGEDKIKCIISKEEMSDAGIEPGDFLSDQEKTQGFIRDVLDQACTALSIEPKGNAYAVQMAVSPCGDLTMIISPDVTSHITDALEEIKKRLMGYKESLEQTKGQLPVATLSNKSDEKQIQSIDTPLWIVLPDLDSAIALSKTVPHKSGIDSVLYKYDDVYYMRMKLDLERIQISSVILACAEYATHLFSDDLDGAYIVEHGKLISKDCVNKLAEI